MEVLGVLFSVEALKLADGELKRKSSCLSQLWVPSVFVSLLLLILLLYLLGWSRSFEDFISDLSVKVELRLQ